MMKHTLMALGLGVGLLGGAATAVHGSASAAPHPTAYHSVARTVSVQATPVAETPEAAAETDATAACATDASGNQTGNCQDASGATDTVSESAAETAGPDTDTAQVGDQSGVDTSATAIR